MLAIFYNIYICTNVYSMPKIKKGVFETDDVITVCICELWKNETNEEMCIDAENVFKNYEW